MVKTTLAQSLAQQMNSIYLDLEAPEDLLKLTDPPIPVGSVLKDPHNGIAHTETRKLKA